MAVSARFGVAGVNARDDADAGGLYEAWVRAAALNQFCVGTEWFELHDQPILGRGQAQDGSVPSLVLDENYAFGLVDITDRPKWDFIDKVRPANLGAAPPAPGTTGAHTNSHASGCGGGGDSHANSYAYGNSKTKGSSGFDANCAFGEQILNTTTPRSATVALSEAHFPFLMLKLFAMHRHRASHCNRLRRCARAGANRSHVRVATRFRPRRATALRARRSGIHRRARARRGCCGACDWNCGTNATKNSPI